MNTTNIVRQSVGVALVSLLAGCAGWNGMSHQAKATTEGATGGAVVGAAVGGPVGAAVGAGVGGVVAHNNSDQVPTFHAPTANSNQTAQNSTSDKQANSSNAMSANEPNNADRDANANAATGSASNTNAMVQNSTTNATGNNAQPGNEAQDQNLVREAQRALNDKGFSAGAVDGVMGPHTEGALRQFQQAQGLNSTGDLDQQTISALGISQ